LQGFQKPQAVAEVRKLQVSCVFPGVANPPPSNLLATLVPLGELQTPDPLVGVKTSRNAKYNPTKNNYFCNVRY